MRTPSPLRSPRADNADSLGHITGSHGKRLRNHARLRTQALTLNAVHQETAGITARPTSPFPHFGVLLSATPRSARLTRLLTDAQLRSWGYDSDAARHVVAELATNAVTHGRVPGRDFRLEFYVADHTLRIEVTDTQGERLPEPQPPSPDTESGRGLLLVEALADRWGVTEDRFPRKTVWAELRLTAPEPEI